MTSQRRGCKGRLHATTKAGRDALVLRTSLSLYRIGRGRLHHGRLGGEVGLARDPRALGRGLHRHGPHGEAGRQDDGTTGALPALRRVPALLRAVLPPALADDVLHFRVEETV